MIDIINSVFEFSGIFALGYNCYVLIKDKQLKGTSMTSGLFFSIWSVWNVFYYFNLNHFFSFSVSIVVCMLSFTWVILSIYYKFKNRIEKI